MSSVSMTDSLAGLARAPREGAEPRRRLDEPARQEQDERDEQRAEDQQVEVDPSDREELLEEDVEDRAQQGAMDRTDAADERDEEGVEGPGRAEGVRRVVADMVDRKSTRLNSSHSQISYAVFCL